MARALVRPEKNQRDVDERCTHDHAERDQKGDLPERVSRLKPSNRNEVGNHRPTHKAADDRCYADARADDHPGAESRSRQINRAEESTLRRADATDDSQSHASEEPRHGLLEQLGIGQCAQYVGDRQSRRKLELQPIHEDGGIEHADADTEHADAEHVQDELPNRRLRQAEPCHCLDHHRHGTHSRNRCRGRLNVVGPMTTLRSIAVGHRRTEDARKHLATDEESQGEIHIRRGNATQRAENEYADDAEQGVVPPGARRGQPRPSWPGFCDGDRRRGHGWDWASNTGHSSSRPESRAARDDRSAVWSSA